MISRTNSTSNFKGRGHYINLTTGKLDSQKLLGAKQVAFIDQLFDAIDKSPDWVHRGRFKLTLEPSGVKFHEGGNADVFSNREKSIAIEYRSHPGTTTIKEISPHELTSVSVDDSEKSALSQKIQAFSQRIFKLAKSTDVLAGTRN